MINLSVFEFDSESIEITVVNNEPWFNGAQTAKALGYTNPAEALRDNVSGKYSQQLDLGRRGKQPLFINEFGLYQLIMRSNLPKAERFQEWVFEEVLPSIRKTGTYSVNPPAPALTQIQVLAAIAQQMADQERRQLEQEQQLKQQAEALAQIAANKQQAEEALAALPLSKEPAAEIPIRGRINKIVRSYVDRTHAAYDTVWGKLYQELYYRYSFDVNARCKNSKRSKLDQIEANGMLDKLYAIASEVLA
ncbi:MAG TPA: BRO family protein [Kamptonema sp.]|nr:BRO family protein [Kamptonema sp.]